MILASLGKLSVGQSLTDADEISENVIQIDTIDWGAMTDLWWTVQVTTVAATVGTLKFSLVLDTQVGLDGTQVSLMSVDIAAITDLRVATIGRFIAAFNIGKQMAMFLEDDLSDYAFIGMENDLGTGVTISINANLSFTEPITLQHRMAVDSPVTVAGIASAASGSKV